VGGCEEEGGWGWIVECLTPEMTRSIYWVKRLSWTRWISKRWYPLLQQTSIKVGMSLHVVACGTISWSEGKVAPGQNPKRVHKSRD
jgi:hypothetical protein